MSSDLILTCASLPKACSLPVITPLTAAVMLDAWHSVIGDGPMARKRKLTLVLQLSQSSSYEGGDLKVMPSAQILSASRAQGCVSIFPSFARHQVVPVQVGVRHSLTLWAMGLRLDDGLCR